MVSQVAVVLTGENNLTITDVTGNILDTLILNQTLDHKIVSISSPGYVEDMVISVLFDNNQLVVVKINLVDIFPE